MEDVSQIREGNRITETAIENVNLYQMAMMNTEFFLVPFSSLSLRL